MNQLVHILHLEDEPADAELVQARIEAAGLLCRISCVQARNEFEAALRQGGYDLILADYRLPAYDGLSALRAAQEICPEIPFIFVSGTMGEEAVIESLTEGATDYVLKQNLSRLASAIPRALDEAVNRRERHRVEGELRKLSQAVEQSASIIIITDTEGYIEYANPRFTEITGYPLEEVLGMHTRFLRSGHTTREEYKRLWDTINSGREWRGEFQNVKKNGDLYWESASISPIKNVDGVITHYLAVKEDITSRKQAEEDQKLLEKQLRQSQKMESIGRLASGVAHDFNNLLTVIRAYTDLLQHKMGLSGPMNKDLEQIRQAGNRAAALTRQLLAFSRQQVLSPAILDLNDLVTNLYKMLERLIGEDIALETILQPKLSHITADPGQIEQVIMNLTVNARDAMPHGGRITFETKNVYLDESYAQTHFEVPVGPCIMLTVTDTGTGMDESTLARIFEPFFTTKEQGKGTGLGMATVYGIIKQSGGDISVYSELGKGTTFTIYLPATEASASTSIPKYQTRPLPRLQTETILVVEDNDLVRSAVLDVLQTKGYTILEAPNGKEAMLLVEQHQGEIDLLLSDVVMPGMSGGELAEQLQALYPQLKVLLMSGYTDVVLREKIQMAEVEFISKPFSSDKLAAKVRKMLEQ